MPGRFARSVVIWAPIAVTLSVACSTAGQPRDTSTLADAGSDDHADETGPDDASGSAGTLTVDTTCGLVVTAACPNDHRTDGLCGLEEAFLALQDQNSEYGCNWSGAIGLNNTIVIPPSGTFIVTTSLRISGAATIRSSKPETLATIKAAEDTNLFGVAVMMPGSITFQDLHLIGAGQWLETQSTGISISGEAPDGGVTINVARCWIEQFSNGAIVASDVKLNVTDSTLDHNSNDYGDGGGGIFYGTNGDAKSQVDFMTITNSSITHNHSTKGGGLQIQSSSTSQITNSTVSDNLTDGGHGGGISFANNAGPLADGVLSILGSTVAFNGSTLFDGAGIAVGANRELFTENIGNKIYLVGSVVANNCLARMNPDMSFACLSPNDVFGDIYRFQDSLLGSTLFSTIIGSDMGGEGRDGVTLSDLDAGLDPQLTDQGGIGGHHPPVHMLNSDSMAIDAVATLKTVNGMDAAHQFDQRHQLRGFDHSPTGPKVFDLGAVERRTNP